MPSQPKIEVAIVGDDRNFQKTAARVNQRIAQISASGARSGRGASIPDSIFGLDRVKSQIGRLYGSARVGSSGLTGGIGLASRTIPGLGLIAGAASVAGIGEMISSLAGAGVELTNTARLAGTTAAGLNSMRGAARLMGLSAGTADQAMLGLNHTLQDAVYGRNSDAANAFRMAGIDIGTMRDGAKSAEAVMPRLVDTLTRVAKTSPMAAERLAEAWGIPSAALPMLIRGNDALQANRKEIERMFGSMDAYQASSERFTFSTARMSLASEKLGMTVMTSLEPHLTPLLLKMSTWMEGHGKDVGEVFDHLGKAIEGVNWSAVGADIDKVGTSIKTAAGYADDFGTRINRMLDTLKAVDAFVSAPGHAFQDWWHGRAPRDSGVDAPMGPDQKRLLERGGNAQMRAGTLPGPEEGMSLPTAGKSAPALPSAEKERRARSARDQLVGLGWTPQQAAGIVANLYKESGMDAGAVGDGGQAGGIAQWHNDRRQAIRRHFGKAVEQMSVEEQVAAVDWELRNPEKAAGDALRRTTTAAAAGDVVSRSYERPAATEAEATNRARSADAFDRRWSGGPPRSPQLTLPSAVNQQSAAGSQPVVRVDITHSNVPAGVTMTPNVQGNGAELGGIRVRRAMPEAGMAPTFGGT